MSGWLILLVALVCPIMMGTMMFLMMRGMRGHGGHHDADHREEVDREHRAA